MLKNSVCQDHYSIFNKTSVIRTKCTFRSRLNVYFSNHVYACYLLTIHMYYILQSITYPQISTVNQKYYIQLYYFLNFNLKMFHGKLLIFSNTFFFTMIIIPIIFFEYILYIHILIIGGIFILHTVYNDLAACSIWEIGK